MLKAYKINEKSKFLIEIEQLMKNQFPKNSQKSLLPLINSPNGEVLAFFKDNIFIAFCALINHKNITHILYLCIIPEYQNQGHGTKIIEFLKKNKKHIIIADVEDSEEKEIKDIETKKRIKRENFYKKNKFINMPFNYKWHKIQYKIFSTEEISEEEFWKFWEENKGLDKIY